jgi:hypothetical protein
VYLLAAPTRTYYVRYPPGFRAYLKRKYDGDIPFNPSLCLLRVRKNLYGDEESGRILYGLIAAFLVRDLHMRHSPVGRCMFVLALDDAAGSHIATGARLTVVVLLYVDDILVLGSDPMVAEVADTIMKRFPTTPGGDDYLSLEIDHDRTAGELRVTQTGNARALLERTGFASAAPVKTTCPVGFTVLSKDAPAFA